MPGLIGWTDDELRRQRAELAAGVDREAALVELRGVAHRVTAKAGLVDVLPDELRRLYADGDPMANARLDALFSRIATDHNDPEEGDQP